MQCYCCQRCGGNLIPAEDGTTAVCESCGAIQALPHTDITRYNEATRARLNHDYEQAAMLFQMLSTDDPKNSDLHWNLALCQYGIEYQGDHTVLHQAVSKSFEDSDEYFAACINATPEKRRLYIAEGQRIAEQQRLYWEQYAKVGGADIVLCGTENTKRVVSRVYQSLISEQYRVFCRLFLNESESDLQNIKALVALQSAKVLLLFISAEAEMQDDLIQQDYKFFRKQIATDSQKKIIPVAVNVEPQQLSQLFGGLQVQDARQLDFNANIIANINHLFHRKDTVEPATSNVAPIIDVAKRLFENGEMNRATSFFQEAIRRNQECSTAWWYLFRIETENMDIPIGAKLFSDPVTEKAEMYRDMAIKYAADDQKVLYVQQLEDWKERIRKARFEASLKRVRDQIQAGTFTDIENQPLKDTYEYATLEEREKVRHTISQESWAAIKKQMCAENGTPISIAPQKIELTYKYTTSEEKEQMRQELFQHNWRVCQFITHDGEDMRNCWTISSPEFQNALAFADIQEKETVCQFLKDYEKRCASYGEYRKIMDNLKSFFEAKGREMPDLQQMLKHTKKLSSKIKRQLAWTDHQIRFALIAYLPIATLCFTICIMMEIPQKDAAIVAVIGPLVLLAVLAFMKNIMYLRNIKKYAQRCTDLMQLYDSKIDRINATYEPKIGKSNVIRDYHSTESYARIIVRPYKA